MPVITPVITINGPDHSSDLKDLDDSIFVQSPNVIVYFFIPEACAIPCALFFIKQTNKFQTIYTRTITLLGVFVP